MQVVYKYDLFTFVFLHFFQLLDKCNNIGVTFLENLFIEFTTHVALRIAFTQGKC